MNCHREEVVNDWPYTGNWWGLCTGLVVTEDEACISGHEFRGPSVYCKSGPVFMDQFLYINGQALWQPETPLRSGKPVDIRHLNPEVISSEYWSHVVDPSMLIMSDRMNEHP